MPILYNLFQNIEVEETSISLIPKPDKTSQENYKPASLMNTDTRFLNKIPAN